MEKTFARGLTTDLVADPGTSGQDTWAGAKCHPQSPLVRSGEPMTPWTGMQRSHIPTLPLLPFVAFTLFLTP